MSNKSELSRVEVKGLEAKFYDFLLLAGTFGLYQTLLKRVISDMNIEPKDRILDMGAGTGKNACLMRRYLSDKGFILGLDIGEVMLKKFEKKCRKYKNIQVSNQRIEESLPYKGDFDKTFISFVIHGFEQDNRIKIINNAYNALKPGGKFFIFDWTEFNIKKTGAIFRSIFNIIECPLAFDFVEIDFKSVLQEHGFKNIHENLYAGKKIRLLSGEK